MGDENTPDPENVEESESSGNPSWKELYAVLPDSLHSLVAPVLEKWETGTQSQFTKHAEQQKSYEPYQQFVDDKIDPDQIAQALSVAQLIDTDPKAFMAQMQAFFGEEKEANPAPQDNKDDGENFEEEKYDFGNDPRFKQIKDQQDTIAGYLAQQVEQQEAAKNDALLTQDIDSLTKKYGEFDQDYVFGLALNGVDMEVAVKQYHALVEGIRSKPAADAGLPNILTPGGGVPSEQVSPADMNEDQRKALVMSILAQANKT